MLATLVLALAVGATSAGNDAAAEWAALRKEHAATEMEVGYREQAAAFAPRFRAFAEKHAGTPEALAARFCLLGDCWWKRSESEEAMYAAGRAMAEEILEEYPDADGLVEFTTRAYVLDRAGKELVFSHLRRSDKRLLQASGLLGMARLQRGEEAQEMYRLLAQHYADVPYRHTTHGRIAHAMLNKHDPADLEVGKVAPDIEGEDAEGVPFRLSDYRGKVVLLDFWGHW